MSAICSRFVQNAWKKDLCSNCFKSKEEHALNSPKAKLIPIPVPVLAEPKKGIIKTKSKKNGKRKVNFPKELSYVIGYGGECGHSDSSDDNYDDDDDFNQTLTFDEAFQANDDAEQELLRLTKNNTDFNMNNGNLLGDPETNIKRSFAALKLGAPKLDSDGKKQTLQIQVVPFGGTQTGQQKVNDMKQIFNSTLQPKKKDDTRTTVIVKANLASTIIPTVAVINQKESPLESQEKNTLSISNPESPDIERKPTEKTLLEEISETLEKNNLKENLLLETEKLAIKNEDEVKKTTNTEPSKRTITRHVPITKDSNKPKVIVFQKQTSESESNHSDFENGSVSDYYDVVANDESYENLPDGAEGEKQQKNNIASIITTPTTPGKIDASDWLKRDEIITKPLPAINQEKPKSTFKTNKTSFFSSQFISDMFLSNKPVSEHLRKRSEVYSFNDGTYISSKITPDGLIVTKNSADDAMDSTSSSFDSSSDEEMSSMNRSESDSGIGICATNEYQNLEHESRIKDFTEYDLTKAKTMLTSTLRTQTRNHSIPSNNSSDYEDIQVQTADCVSQDVDKESYVLDKSRESAGEPDGRADPEGSAETIPALPTSPPPAADPRPSFLHGLQKPAPNNDKPKVPAKPAVNIIKPFIKKPQSIAQQQVIMQLQQVFKNPEEEVAHIENGKPTLSKQDSNDLAKTPKKGRAPDPPPSPVEIHTSSIVKRFDSAKNIAETDDKKQATIVIKPVHLEEKKINDIKCESVATLSLKTSLPTRNPPIVTDDPVSIYTRNPTAALKSNSPVVREKDKRERAIINPKFRSLTNLHSNRNNYVEKTPRPHTPEPAPRKSLSLSQDCLQIDGDKIKQKKNKFSIRKFLRMGNSKQIDGPSKKDSLANSGHLGSPELNSDGMPLARPRLVIIHPLDINTSAVEVVNARNSTDFQVAESKVIEIQPPTVTGKPPAPPQRTTFDNSRTNDLNKPARPPPPKSAELRRKQKMGFCPSPEFQKKVSRLDNVYANLGEVRSSIAPRKPERTASMREREAQLEIVRRKPTEHIDYVDTASDISSTSTIHADKSMSLSTCTTLSRSNSNTSDKSSEIIRHSMPSSCNNRKENESCAARLDKEDNCTIHTETNGVDQHHQKSVNRPHSSMSTTSSASSSSYNDSFNERKKRLMELESNKLASKVELFERNIIDQQQKNIFKPLPVAGNLDAIKNSIQKMNSTVDSYLKDKLSLSTSEANIYETQSQYSGKSLTKPIINNNSISRASEIELRSNYETVTTKQLQRSSLPDNGSIYGDAGTRRPEVTNQLNDYPKKYNGSFASIPRAISMSYCGSEMGESEIYSPYSFYGSEAGTDVAIGDPNDGWNNFSNGKGRSVKTTNRLRMRKGRSVVHKNLEDNYGAVIVANHEALAQVLEQLQQTSVIPLTLRPLANTMNLRFDDFTILETARGIVVGRRAFHTAIWSNHIHVTLALSSDCNQMYGVGGELNQLTGAASGALNPITEFSDLVPSHYLPLMPCTQVRMVQATISVLPRMQVDTLQSLGNLLKSRAPNNTQTNMKLNQNHLNNFSASIPNLTTINNSGSNASNTIAMRNGGSVQNLTTLIENISTDKDVLKNDLILNKINSNNTSPIGTLKLSINLMNSNYDDIIYREVGFIMLQLVNGLKNLQSKGNEEMPLSLSNVILCKEAENKEAQARLCVLQGANQDLSRDDDEPMATLCQCALTALTNLLPNTKLTPILVNILEQERSETLSKAKSVLEFALWGPSDVQLTGSLKEREMALQRWLDLERATVLHGLVRTRVELTVYDECHLMFLVRSNAKIMCEASNIISNFTLNE